MINVDSSSVDGMIDSSGTDLLREINEKRKKARLFPGVILLFVIATLILVVRDESGVTMTIFGATALGSCVFIRWYDQIRKTTVIIYELEPEGDAAYRSLHEVFSELQSCDRIWQVESQGEVQDQKYHAGAKGVVRRNRITLVTGSPPFIKTNIEIPLIPAGRQMLAFMPDRLLVVAPAGVGAVSYADLILNITELQFIEEGTAPRDTTVVGRTWRYVNKKGGPDRRFKDNRELLICAYEAIHFSSNSGLNEVIQVSRRGVGAKLEQAVAAMRNLRAGAPDP